MLRMIVGAALLGLAAYVRASSASAETVPPPVAGQWAGLVGAPGGARTYVAMTIAADAGGLQATYVVPGAGVGEHTATVRAGGDGTIEMSLALGDATGVLRAHAGARSMTGTFTAGERSSPAELRRMIRRPWRELRPYAGDYAFPNGDELVISAPYTYLAYLDRRSGRSGLLATSDGAEFFSGPGRRLYAPVEQTFTFVRDETGAVTGVTVRGPGVAVERARRVVRSRSRDVTFASDGAQLSGTFTTPLGTGPFPTVVLFAGSNEQTRDAQYGIVGFAGGELVRRGFAVFAYDKRGFAESTGERTDAFAARDGIAAVRTVRTFADVDQQRVGLWGISQGGMIEPAVARADGNIAFIIDVSGSMASGNEQEIERTERQMRADGFTERDIADAVAFQRLKFHYAETGRDWDAYAAAYRAHEHAAWFPDPYVGPPAGKDSRAWTFWREQGTRAPADDWAFYRGPVLYVQGELETLSDPARAAALFRAAMARAGNERYTIVVVPHAEHTMFRARTGGEREDRFLNTVAPGYFAAMTSWLQTLELGASRSIAR